MPQPQAVRSIATTISHRLPDDDDGLNSIMALVREHLGMDLVFVSEFTRGHQVYRALAGDAESFGVELDNGPLLEETYCNLMVAGEIPQVIADTSTNRTVAAMDVTAERGIGAYLGVPLRFADGQLYGTFCCLSREPDDRLTSRDLAYMELLGMVLAERLEAKANRRRRLQEIEGALATGSVVVALQPIIRLVDSTVAGAEALARFPDLGLPPDLVIEQAHEVGLGAELELLALSAALPLVSEIPDDGYLSVNVGPAAMLSPAFLDTLRTCERPDLLCLEITEHTSIAEYSQLNRIVAPLRLEGMKLAVDDVGAGYASLRHVLQMQPDILKIDRSLITDIANDPGRRSIVTSIVLLALDLNATVVAEGVEQQTDRDTLTDLGVDMMQGYLFARPSSDPADWALWQTPAPPPRAPSTALRAKHQARTIRLDAAF